MDDWKPYLLSDIIEIIGGGTPRTTNLEYWNGDIPWLSVADYNINRKYVKDTGRKITKLGLEKSSTKLLNAGDVIISARGTVGVVAMLARTMAFNQTSYGIRAMEGITLNDYVYYLLKDTVENFHRMAYGAVFDTITRNTFNDVEITLPPLPEQRAIADVLSALDDKIDLLHRQNETLESLAQTLFRQWFVEEAEDGWEEKTLGDVLTTKGGTTPSTKNPDFWDGDIYWTTPRDLSNNDSPYLLDTARKITPAGLDKISSGLLPDGTLLLSSRAPVGYLGFSDIPLAINQGYIAIIDNKGVSKHFFYLWLRENMDYVKSFANGSTFLEISKSAFRTLEIVIPPSDIRNKFEEITLPLFEKIRKNVYQIRTIEKLRDTLLPKLMSGGVRVRYEELGASN